MRIRDNALLIHRIHYYEIIPQNSIATMTFQLHPRLEQDCVEIGRLPLSRLLLMNDSQYPWCLLVPEREDIVEIYQLSPEDRQQLQVESCLLSAKMAEVFRADKMNIAAIGNLVPQLHIHHIVRYRTDIAWPAPVWGYSDALPYDKKQTKEIIRRLKEAMKDALID